MAKKDILEREPHDQGVPMLVAKDPHSEPTGPEDALGLGPKRGDYTDRLGGSAYLPHTVVPVDVEDDEGNPAVEYVNVNQKEFAGEIGDEPGKKGGVDTHSDHEAGLAVQKSSQQDSKKSS